MPPLAGILRDLRIDDWKRAVASATGADALLAERLLGHIYVQTAFYLPERFNQEGSFGRSAFVLSVAAEIRPEKPAVWIALARAQAKAGRRGDARRTLQRALEKGGDAGAIKADPVLAPLMADGEMTPAPR